MLEGLIKYFRIEKFHIKFLSFIAVVIIISSNILSYINTNELLNDEQDVTATAKNIENLETLREGLEEAQNGRDFYFMTGDESYLEPYYRVSGEIDTIYSKLKGSIADKPNQKLYFDSLTMLVRERFMVMNKGIEAQSKNNANKRLVKSILEEGKDIQTNLYQLLNRMKVEERRILREKIDIVHTKAQFTNYAMIGGTFFSIILLIIAFSLLNKGKEGNLFDVPSGKMTAEELEEIVKRRTEEISEINKKLFAEIDKQKIMQEAMRESEMEYKMIFEQAHDAIIIFKPETGIILDVNERACELYNISKKDFIGLSIKTLSKNIPELEENIKNTIDKGYYYNFQTVHYNKNGTEMLMEINASVINYKTQKAIMSINRDITDRILSYIHIPGS